MSEIEESEKEDNETEEDVERKKQGTVQLMIRRKRTPSKRASSRMNQPDNNSDNESVGSAFQTVFPPLVNVRYS